MTGKIGQKEVEIRLGRKKNRSRLRIPPFTPYITFPAKKVPLYLARQQCWLPPTFTAQMAVEMGGREGREGSAIVVSPSC